MREYLNAECYKVLHRRYTYIALAVLLGCVVLLVALWWTTNAYGGHVPLSGALYTLVMMLSVGLYAPIITTDLVFSDQYKLGTMKNEVSYGLPRGRIYLGKLTVEVGVAAVACVLAVALYLALCVLTLTEGADPDGMFMRSRLSEMWALVPRALLSAFPLWLGAQGVTHLCFFHLRGGVSAPFMALAVILGLPGVLKLLGMLLDPVFMTLRSFTLVAPMDAWDFPVWQCWAIGLGWFAVSTLLGLALFRKREIN